MQHSLYKLSRSVKGGFSAFATAFRHHRLTARIRFAAALAASVCFATLAHGDVRVSEFLAVNTQMHPDIVDFTDYPDWIELENTGNQPVALDGYYLSDSRNKPLKWPFPAGAVIPANGHLLIWADGHDAGPGESRARGYWPWRNFTTAGYHTNFSLSSEGEAVVLTKIEGLASSTLVRASSPTVIPPDAPATWRFLADGSDAGSRWRARSFDDSSWPSGPGVLGYGSSSLGTIVPFGPSSSNKYITTYFRHEFTVADPRNIANLTFGLLVDDGAIVYLNGVEILRQNLRAGEINYLTPATLAISGSAENQYTNYKISPENLLAGSNVIAVEVHQSSGSSSDIKFDLRATADTFTGFTQLDSVTFGPQVDDISTGRDPGNGNDWVAYASPTPGTANSGATVTDIRLPGTRLAISLPGGFHSSPQSVAIEAESGEIRYTLDGSLPGSESPLYEAPLDINRSTVLRARVFAHNLQPGPVETRTYFIDEVRGTLPTVSLVSDPEALFGDRTGIYYNQYEPLVNSSSNAARGLRDVFKGKDAPGSLEFFSSDGSPGFRVNGGIRMGGENNWVHAQRAVNFALRGKYGDDAIKYDLFPGSGIPLHASLTLRDGGDAWHKEMLRDGMWPFIAKGRLNADTSDYRPSILYINGNYWGIHNIRSRWDDQWFFEHKRVNADKVDHLLYGHVESSATTLGVEKGNAADWLDLLAFLNSSDLTTPQNQAFYESRIDIDSFIDFIVAESYGINVSWRHNREFWRERKPGAKWKWFLPDMDQTFRTSLLGTSVLNDMLSRDEVLVRLKTSPAFIARLAQRFAAHMESTFKPSRVHGILDALAGEVEGEAPRHIERWQSSGGMTAPGRSDHLAEIRTFASARASGIYPELQSRLGVSSPVTLTLQIDPPSGGSVSVSGVVVEAGPLRLFPNIPFALTADAAPGFVFAGWTGLPGDDSTSLSLSSPTSVTARFMPSDDVVIGGTLASDTTLADTGSAYVVDEDLIVPAGVVLNISSGVEIHMTKGRNIRVQGRLVIGGTSVAPVRIAGRNGARWGGISFENPDAASKLSHLVIRHATRGHSPIVYPSAISTLDAELEMEFIDIRDSEGPVFARGGSTILRNSSLHTPYTGDCINIKGGYAETIDCRFFGNDAPDTDAIDYDGVVGGIIRGNVILRFEGFNSDGIDIGEQCRDVIIEENKIYYCSDKGVSVGQGSSVIIRRNLVVGCSLGVGIKDFGSTADIDQNTFVNCISGVEVYEKNFGMGGGSALIQNTIFSRCSSTIVGNDAFSTVITRYCLSDTVAIAGDNNLLSDPQFADPSVLNFTPAPGSPVIDAGDPAHAPDQDDTRADIGAALIYSPDDYPYIIGESIVIEEILANSGSSPDWVKLRNRTSESIDIGGWFLSDSGRDLLKYRIPSGTVIPPGGHATFNEDVHFGAASTDPGRITPFAISATGETLHISSAEDNELTAYRSKENFGASMPGVSLGNYYKASSNSWNFIALETPSPTGANSPPRIGPVVISEIMFEPAGHPDAEYIEIRNITAEPVSLYDSARKAAWRITDGIWFEFPSAAPVILGPGERMILTRSTFHFFEEFSVPAGTRVMEWTSGRLSNEGERVQIGRPAGLDDQNIRHYARVDRVTYGVSAPWPAESGQSLRRINDNAYGNDFDNWTATVPNPGLAEPDETFDSWIAGFQLGPEDIAPGGDPDGDGRPNLLEYALGSSPAAPDSEPPFRVTRGGDVLALEFSFARDTGVAIALEHSPSLADDSWTALESELLEVTESFAHRRVSFRTEDAPVGFFRMRATVADP